MDYRGGESAGGGRARTIRSNGGEPGWYELELSGEADTITLGRVGGDATVTIDNSSLSRLHGTFQRFGSVWTYSDANSTNGSEWNNMTLRAGEPVLLRSGDRIKAGVCPLLVTIPEEESAAPRNPTLFIFAQNEFAGEIEMNDEYPTVTVGGEGSDITLMDMPAREKLLGFAQQGATCIMDVATELTVSINDRVCRGASPLRDQDRIITPYCCILVSMAPELAAMGDESGEEVRPATAREGTVVLNRSDLSLEEQDDTSLNIPITHQLDAPLPTDTELRPLNASGTTPRHYPPAEDEEDFDLMSTTMRLSHVIPRKERHSSAVMAAQEVPLLEGEEQRNMILYAVPRLAFFLITVTYLVVVLVLAYGRYLPGTG